MTELRHCDVEGGQWTLIRFGKMYFYDMRPTHMESRSFLQNGRIYVILAMRVGKRGRSGLIVQYTMMSIISMSLKEYCRILSGLSGFSD